MSNVTVNISFQGQLLAEIDAEAARLYVRRQKQWSDLFALGDQQVARGGLTEADVRKEIRAARKRRIP